MQVDVVEEFIKLASINSPSRREGRLAAYLVSRIREMGLDPVVDSSAPLTGSDTGNIFISIPGNAEGPAILLCAHMDTVGPTEGMVPVLRNEIIYSNGETVLGADDKAGIAMILAALGMILEDKSPHGPIEALFTVQEEIGLFGARYLQIDLKADYGYVIDGDGDVGTIAHQSPTKIDLFVVIKGRAAHAARPEKGINAIAVASSAIARIVGGRIDEDTTANVGLIRGGNAINIVPDKAEIACEFRGFNGDKLEKEVRQAIEAFTSAADKAGAEVVIKRELGFEAFNMPRSHAVVVNAFRAAELSGIEPRLQRTGGGMDANVFNGRGLPCVGLGMGARDEHTPNESISVSQLRDGARFIKTLLTGALNNSFKDDAGMGL
jgi:tripeptide aminopeptidase